MEDTAAADKAIPLGVRIKEMISESETDRREYEIQWAKNLRQYKAVYESDVKISPNRSKSFLNLTKIKVKAMDSRCLDMLFPGGTEKNWSVEPTPVPEVDQVTAQHAANGLIAMAQETGQMPTEEDIRQAVTEHAKAASEGMAKLIADQLQEGHYKRKCRKVFHSGHLFGTGVLKGPIKDVTNLPQWREDPQQAGEFVKEMVSTDSPYFNYRRIWDMYPDMSVDDVEDMGYHFERHIVQRRELLKWASRDDFDGAAIAQHVKVHPEGDAKRKAFEEELRGINDKDNAIDPTLKNKYEVWEGWVYLDGIDLAEICPEILSQCGDGESAEDQVMMLPAQLVEVWILGDSVIKASPAPQHLIEKIPYNYYYFEADENSVFGSGLPEIMENGQVAVNASNRAMLDNAAASAGPITEVNVDLLEPGQSPEDIAVPWNNILREGKGVDAQYPAVRFLVVPNLTPNYAKLVEFYKMFTDEISSVPAYMHGENDNGAGKTASGLSMLMGAAGLTMKDVVANFDEGITVPFITSLFEFNMIHSPDQTIKGDMKIKAQGSTALIAREIRSRQLDEFASSTANPMDEPYVNRRNLLEERVKARELPDSVLYSEDDAGKIKQMTEAINQLKADLEQMAKDNQSMAAQLQKNNGCLA